MTSPVRPLRSRLLLPETLPFPDARERRWFYNYRGAGVRTYVYDSFTRADSATTLGTADTGQVWDAAEGTWGIDSGQAALITVSGTSRETALIDAGVSDCTVRATFGTDASGTFAQRLVVRATDKLNNFYVANMNTAGVVGDNITLWKREAAASSNMAPAAAHTWAIGDVVEVVLSGSSITVLVNGAALIAASSAFNQTATKHGLAASNNTSPRWTDFRVTA